MSVALGSGWDASAAGRPPYGGEIVVPVQRLEGLEDPHGVWTPSGRLVASLSHSGLFRVEQGTLRLGLAADFGRSKGRRLRIGIRPGATFHGGQPVTVEDVVASLRRALKHGSRVRPLGELWRALDVRVAPAAVAADGTMRPAQVEIRGPDGLQVDELRLLLARPEAAVIRRGEPGPGHGAGPFQPEPGATADAAVLEAFDGYATGRPFLDRVVLRVVRGGGDEASAYVYGDVDLAFGISPRLAASPATGRPARESIVLVPHPRYRSPGARELRQAMAVLARRSELQRTVDAPATTSPVPWPAALRPTTRGIPSPERVKQVPALVVAYPNDDPALVDLAAAVRDALRPVSGGEPRAVATPGLDVDRAVAAPRSAPWDVALVRLPWGALTPAQAAWEAAVRLDLPDPAPDSLFTASYVAWAEQVAREAWIIPVLHASVPVRVSAGWFVGDGAAGRPELGETWRVPADDAGGP